MPDTIRARQGRRYGGKDWGNSPPLLTKVTFVNCPKPMKKVGGMGGKVMSPTIFEF